jgi:hypothetical protein
MRNPTCFNKGNAVPRLFLWIVPIALLLLASTGSGDSVRSETTTTPAVKVTKAVPFVRESIDDIKRLAPFRSPGPPGNRAIPFHRIPRESGAAGSATGAAVSPALAAPSRAGSPAPSAPALDRNFAGLGNPLHSERDVIPPDTMGAAGPGHLVSLMNSDFGVFDKATGALLQKTTLQSFWGSLGTAAGQPADFPFDPKILYDPHSGRFVAVTLGGPNSLNSWVLIAVSASSDPTGPWNKWAIDADRDNDAQQFNNWADFPGVGLDGNNLYVSANMFSIGDTFQYGKIWVVPMPQLLSGSPILTRYELVNPSGSSFNMQPAHSFGNAPSEYFLFEGTSTHLLMARIETSSGTPVWHAPVAVNISPSYPLSDSLPGAPQKGNDNTIDTSDSRLLNVVYRAGSLWTVHTVPSPSTAKTEIAWYQIDPVAATITSQGRISDPNRWYYYPSIGVNANGDVAIGMSGSSTTEYVGGYYTARRFADLAGTMQPVSLLHAGENSYYKVFSESGNRWGDYSATVVDPNGNLRFWTLQEYAKTSDPVSGNSRWGTWWGSFLLPPLSAPSAPVGLTGTPLSGSTISLAWTDTSSVEDFFVIERKTGGGPFSVLATPSTSDIAGYLDMDTSLVERATYTYRVKAGNSLGDSVDSNESTVTTLLATPDNTTAVAVSTTRVDITWTDMSSLETGYRVERKPGPAGSFVEIASLPSNAGSYTDNSVLPGRYYSYRIQATDNVTPTASAFSNESAVTTPGSPAIVDNHGGGGCLSIRGDGVGTSFLTVVFSVGTLFLPAFALGWRRFARRKEPGAPIRHFLC